MGLIYESVSCFFSLIKTHLNTTENKLQFSWKSLQKSSYGIDR